jgi:glycosyltransferase
MYSNPNWKVTLITPTFNRAAQLEQALASVLHQSVLPHEHIICDNCSSDATSAVVQNYTANAPFPVVYRREQDRGIYQAMNRALQAATGNTIFILNDDDQFHNPDVLRVFGNCLAASQADLIYGDTVWRDPATESRKYRHHKNINKLTLVHKAISQQAIFYNARVFEKCGLFDETFKIAGDYEWLLRAFLGKKIAAVYLNRPVTVCSLGGLSNSTVEEERRRAERREATMRWYTEREVELSGLYRHRIRKFPLGTTLFNLFCPLKLNIKRARYDKRRG